MNLLCPNCQKMLQVPDQFAGQMMKCPLCGSPFTVPPLTTSWPPTGPASAPAAQAPSQANAPAAPAAGYQHVYCFALNPKYLAWIAPAALVIVVVLLFFPWVEAGVSVEENPYPSTGWQIAFGELSSGLGTFYVLLLLLALMVAIGSAVLPLLPPGTLPPAAQQIMPWRASAVALAALLVFLLLALLLTFGFGPEHNTEHPIFGYVRLGNNQLLLFTKTAFMRLALFFHVVAVVGAGLDAWVSMRGPSKPPPRVDINL